MFWLPSLSRKNSPEGTRLNSAIHFLQSFQKRPSMRRDVENRLMMLTKQQAQVRPSQTDPQYPRRWSGVMWVWRNCLKSVWLEMDHNSFTGLRGKKASWQVQCHKHVMILKSNAELSKLMRIPLLYLLLIQSSKQSTTTSHFGNMRKLRHCQ